MWVLFGFGKYKMGIHQNKNKNWNGFGVKVLLRCKRCSKDFSVYCVERRDGRKERERKTQKQRENSWLRWMFFNLWMCCLPHVTHLNKNRRKIEGFKREGALFFFWLHKREGTLTQEKVHRVRNWQLKASTLFGFNLIRSNGRQSILTIFISLCHDKQSTFFYLVHFDCCVRQSKFTKVSYCPYGTI